MGYSDESKLCRSIASTGAIAHIQAENECDSLVGLVRRQKHVCRRNVEMMEAVKSGAVVAIHECQQQFRNRRWNCTTVNAVSVFGKIHNSGTYILYKPSFCV